MDEFDNANREISPVKYILLLKDQVGTRGTRTLESLEVSRLRQDEWKSARCPYIALFSVKPIWVGAIAVESGH